MIDPDNTCVSIFCIHAGQASTYCDKKTEAAASHLNALYGVAGIGQWPSTFIGTDAIAQSAFTAMHPRMKDRFYNSADPLDIPDLRNDHPAAAVADFLDTTLRDAIASGKKDILLVTSGDVLQHFMLHWASTGADRLLQRPDAGDVIEIHGSRKFSDVRKLFCGTDGKSRYQFVLPDPRQNMVIARPQMTPPQALKQ